MTVSEQRVDKLYLGLSAHERVVMCLRWSKEGTEPPTAFRGSTPDSQIPEINRLLRRFNATQHEVSWYGDWLQARLETVSVLLGVAGAFHLWALHAESLKAQLALAKGLPSRRSAQGKALRALLAEAPIWPTPEQVPELARPESNPTPSALTCGLLLRSAGELSDIWSQLLAVEHVVQAEAEAFDGEEPIRPETRERLDEIRQSALSLVEELKPDFGELVLPDEPHQRVVELLSTIIAHQASIA